MSHNKDSRNVQNDVEILGHNLFVSWQFAREFTDCPLEKITERVIYILRSKGSALKLRGKKSTYVSQHWILYLCPFNFITIPIKCLSSDKVNSILNLLERRSFSCREIIRNEDVLEFSCFTEDYNIKLDQIACIRACYTYIVLQLMSHGTAQSTAESVAKNCIVGTGTASENLFYTFINSVYKNDNPLSMLEKKDHPEFYKIASVNIPSTF